MTDRILTALCAPLFLCAAASAATAPLVNMDFTRANQDEGLAVSTDGLLEYHLDEAVKVVRAGGPTGRPYLLFDGSPESGVRVNASKIGQRFTGEEFSASFWVRVDRPKAEAKALMGLGVDGPSDNAGDARLSLYVPTKPTDFDPYNLYAKFIEDNTPTGVWHHVAISYSMTNLNYRIWFNGAIQRDMDLAVDQPAPALNPLTLPVAKGFAGAIAEVKVWNSRIPDEELLTMTTPKDAVAESAAAFEAAAKTAAFKSFGDWCAANVAALRAFGPTCRVRDWMRVQEARRALPRIAAWAREFSLDSASSSFAAAPVLPLTIYPYSIVKRLPYLLPFDGRASAAVSFAAAAGEYESRSVMFYPLRDVKGFSLRAGDLVGPGGAKIPKSKVDLRIVKVWYTTGSGWNSYFGGGREYPVLTPELVLYDDALVKCVPGKRKNYLRLSYPDGARYVDISRYGTPESIPKLNFFKEPIHDATTLQPLDLEAGSLRQYWITVHVPGSAPAGSYRGRIEFLSEGGAIGSMPLSLDVHPYTLPKAATRYNIDKRFYSTWMNNTLALSIKLNTNPFSKEVMGMTSLSNACRRLLAEYKNMAAHNMLNPWTVAYYDEANPDLTEMQLDLMREAGLETRPLFGDLHGFEPKWCGEIPREAGRNSAAYPNGIEIENMPEVWAECMASFSNKVKRTFDQVERKLGHREVVCYGIDEAGPDTVRREMPFFATIRHEGGKPMISMCHSKWVSFAVCADDTPASIGRFNAQLWHEGGAETYTYAAPFSGPSNPVLWRRNKGIRLYMANYDGCNEYVLFDGTDPWNEFCYNSRYCVFSIVFQGADGIIDTVEWEALREAHDDIRYLTLLRRLAREAIRGGKRPSVRLGRLAYAWAEAIDQESVDLDQMRADAVGWIARLRDALSADGVDTAKFSAY